MSDNNDPSFPKHIAIIMDGNGRWAKSKGLPRTAGHKKGIDAVRRVVKSAPELGVEFLTLFGFSSENWRRPQDEISELMGLLRYYLKSEMSDLHKNNIKLKVIGDIDGLDADISDLIRQTEELTKDNSKFTLIFALNYGGRDDILNAAIQMAKDGVADNEKALDVFEKNLSTYGIPDPDLLIRTSGEKRISNFLLWQCAYSEMVFEEDFWPDFGKEHLERSIAEYKGRDRRFGNVDVK